MEEITMFQEYKLNVIRSFEGISNSNVRGDLKNDLDKSYDVVNKYLMAKMITT